MGRKPALDKKAIVEFDRRWLAIRDRIPGNYISKVKDVLPEANEGRIRMVRYGTTKDPEILSILESIATKK